MTGARATDRWAAHPLLGGLLRVLVLLLPVLAGVLVAVAVARALAEPDGLAEHVVWWVAVLGSSLAAVLLSDRVARQLLPLAVLLEVSLVFPDRAPSRLRAARTSSVRDLENRLARLRAEGMPMQPYEAAETLVVLVGILGVHDKRTRGHSERVRAFTDLLTAELGLPEDDRVRLRWAALVHDLGKLTVSPGVLNGGRDLSDDDWASLRRHPAEGERLVGGLLPWLGEWGGAVAGHHERWDGTGYPYGLSGEGISYAARIVALADSFEVMTAARSYKAAMSAAEARRELARCAGTQFDPALVRAFLGISIGRLRWVMGPLTWLAQLPFVGAGEKAGQAVKGVAVSAAVGGLVAIGALPGPGGDERRAPLRESAAAPAPVLPPAAPAPAPLPDVSTSPAAEPTTEPTTQPAGDPTPEPNPEPTPSPPPTDDPTPSSTPSPAPTAEPRPSPSATRQPSPSPSVEPSPTPSPTGSPTPPPPGPTTLAFFLAPPSALETSAPAAGSTSLAEPTAFSRVVEQSFALEAADPPTVELFLDFTSPGVSGQLDLRLQECAAAGCTDLATGSIKEAADVQRYVEELTPTSPTAVVEAGGTLRLLLEPRGVTKSTVTLSTGGATASRLDVPAVAAPAGTIPTATAGQRERLSGR